MPCAGYITEYSATIKLTMSDKIQSKNLVSIYTLSDLGDLSNLIGSLSQTIVAKYLTRREVAR